VVTQDTPSQIAKTGMPACLRPTQRDTMMAMNEDLLNSSMTFRQS
jgi:hypothetical protein